MQRRTFLQAAAAIPLAGAPPARPNILIVTTDQQSADAMSCRIGPRYIRTPHIDSLAAQGRLFTRAYCANPLCVPSRTSLFTGRYPVETGYETNDLPAIDAQRFPNLGLIFRRAGYATGYFGKWHLPYPQRDSDVHGWTSMERGRGRGDTGAADAACRFLEQKRDAPFLVVASLVNPHNICQWARNEDLPDGSVGTPPPLDQCPPLRPNSAPQRNESDTVALMRRSYQSTPMFPVGNFGEKQWREYIWAYYRMIEKVDALIGRILDTLRATGQEKNTLVVFSADHGDCQGAHGWNQKTILWEEAVRVPFIFSQPGVTRPGVSGRLVHTGVDLLPTLCGYAGIPVPAGLSGLDLRSAVGGHDGSDPRDFVLVSNRMVQGAAIEGRLPTPDGRAVIGRRWKYTVYSEGNRRESLVDLAADPGEMNNLAADPRHRPELLRQRTLLAAWCARYRDDFPQAAG